MPARSSDMILQQTHEETTLVKFMILKGKQLQVVEEILVFDFGDQIVEQADTRYASQGHFLFSSNLRSVPASQCFRSASEDGTGTIILIPEGTLSEAECGE